VIGYVLSWMRARRYDLAPPWETRVLVLNYTGGEGNWGCQTTSVGLLSLISKAYGTSAVLTVPIWFAGEQDQYDLPDSPDGWDDYLNDLTETPGFDRFGWADVVIMNGEGTIHEWPDMATRPESYLRLLEIYAASVGYGKPVMAVNQSIDYWSEGFGRWVQAAFKGCDYVSVREPISARKLAALGLEDVEVVPDAAFLTKPADDDAVGSFMDSRGIEPGFVAFFLGETVQDLPPDRLERAAVLASDVTGRPVVFFAGPWGERRLASEVASRLQAPVVGMEAGPEMLVGLLQRSSLVVSGRYHCCIFAALAPAPLLPLTSNTHKIEGVMEMLQYPVRPVELAEDGQDGFECSLKQVWETRDELKAVFERTVPEAVRLTERGYPNVLKGGRPTVDGVVIK
jgi:hypothetical protein